MGTIKDKNDKDLTETKENKKWQEYTEELYKKGFMTMMWSLIWSQHPLVQIQMGLRKQYFQKS